MQGLLVWRRRTTIGAVVRNSDWSLRGKGAVVRGLTILCGILALCLLALGTLSACALPLSEFSRVYPYLVRKARICLLTGIPTPANPIMDAELLAQMRRRLPDTFACGRCRYDLAGDLTAAYYLKTCR
jgi:hypothetical protein